jgi:hypothetical protein
MARSYMECDSITKTGTSGAMGGLGLCPIRATFRTRPGVDVTGLYDRSVTMIPSMPGKHKNFRRYCTKHANRLIAQGRLRPEDLEPIPQPDAPRRE